MYLLISKFIFLELPRYHELFENWKTEYGGSVAWGFSVTRWFSCIELQMHGGSIVQGLSYMVVQLPAGSVARRFSYKGARLNGL